jgi:shikimate dehydrogenase
MHGAALALCGIRGVYLPFNVKPEHLAVFLETLLDGGFRGLNVTVPHKERVMPLLAGVDPAALRIGAVNTLTASPDGKGWLGSNTDAPGFACACLEGLAPCPALVLGAGGAARAVVASLLDNGFGPRIAARRPERAEALAGSLTGPGGARATTAPWPAAGGGEGAGGPGGPWRLVVSCLSASSPDELGPDPPRPLLGEGGLMADLNYGRPDNWFRTLAEEAGATFRDGLHMLAAQARLSFITWTGREDVPLEPFLKAAAAKGA